MGIAEVKGFYFCNKCGLEVEHPEAEHECPKLNFEKIEQTPEGGMLLWVQSKAFPLKGFPENKKAQTINILKRAIISSIRLFFTNPFNNLPRKVIKWYAEIVQSVYRRVGFEGGFDYDDPNKFCPAVREIYYTGLNLIDSEDGKTALNGLCMILEYDISYRFRVQDIVGELSKENLKLNPSKEINRLIKIALERDWSARDKVKVFARFARVMLWLFKDVRKFVIKFLTELDIEKVKLDEADRYWCMERWDYDFWGEPYVIRKNQMRKIDLEHKLSNPPFVPPPPQPFIGLAPNEEFFKLTKEEAKKKAQAMFDYFFLNQFDAEKTKREK